MIEISQEEEGYLGARSSIATRGTIMTGRSLWKSSEATLIIMFDGYLQHAGEAILS